MSYNNPVLTVKGAVKGVTDLVSPVYSAPALISLARDYYLLAYPPDQVAEVFYALADELATISPRKHYPKEEK